MTSNKWPRGGQRVQAIGLYISISYADGVDGRVAAERNVWCLSGRDKMEGLTLPSPVGSRRSSLVREDVFGQP